MMNQSKESRPPQADLNDALDNTQERIDGTFSDVATATEWLRQAVSDAEKKEVVKLLTDIGHERARLFKQREELIAQMDSLLEEIGEEQAIDLAGAMLRVESGLQRSAEAQQEASNALAEAQEIAFGEQLTADEEAGAQVVVDELLKRFPNLNSAQQAVARRRAARFMRMMNAEEATQRLRIETESDLSGDNKPRAWESISWHASA